MLRTESWESFLRPQTHDAEDGYDTVQWAAGLPVVSGKVGTIGLSYGAFLEWRLAPLRPPALVAMSAHSVPARYTDLEGPGTLRLGWRLQWWIVTMTPTCGGGPTGPERIPKPKPPRSWNGGQAQTWFQFLPWLDLPQEVFEDDTPYVRYWLEHPQTDPWKLDAGCREITVPNLEAVGWYDHAKGDMLLYQTLVKEGKTKEAGKGRGWWSARGATPRPAAGGLATSISVRQPTWTWRDWTFAGSTIGSKASRTGWTARPR